jgi:hypothetical protein
MKTSRDLFHALPVGVLPSAPVRPPRHDGEIAISRRRLGGLHLLTITDAAGKSGGEANNTSGLHSLITHLKINYFSYWLGGNFAQVHRNATELCKLQDLLIIFTRSANIHRQKTSA